MAWFTLVRTVGRWASRHPGAALLWAGALVVVMNPSCQATTGGWTP